MGHMPSNHLNRCLLCISSYMLCCLIYIGSKKGNNATTWKSKKKNKRERKKKKEKSILHFQRNIISLGYLGIK